MAKKVKGKEQKKISGKPFWLLHAHEIIIFVFTFLLFSNSISNNYNMDDELVTKNHRLTSKGVAAIPEIFTSPYYQDNMGYAYEYRPLVLASFAVEHQLWGDNPHVSHFLNVLLYSLCCVLLYRTLLAVLVDFSPFLMLGITLLFVAHPSHTEVVCSIKNRDEILTLIFSLLSLLLAFKAVVKQRMVLLLLLPFVFILALMSKLSAITFVVIVPIVLILFTKINFKLVVLIVFLLGLPAFFILNGVSLYYKIQIEFGLAVLVVSFYVLYHLKELYLQAPDTINGWVRRSTDNHNSLAYDSISSVKENVSSALKYAIGFWSFRAVAFTILMSSMFVAGLILNYPPLVVASMVILGLCDLWGEEKVAWWANMCIYLCLTLAILKYTLGYTIYGNLISIGLFYQIFWGERKLLFPSLAMLLFFLAVAPYSIFFGIGNIALVAFRWKKTWLIGIMFLIGGLYSTYNDVFVLGNNHIWSNTYGVVLGVLLITSLLFFKKWSGNLVRIFNMLALLVLVGYQVELSIPPSAITLKHAAQKTVESIGNRVNTNILSTKQDRPISFIEQPVGPNDSWQLRTGTSLEILFHYIYKVVLPYPMAFYYGYQFIKPQSITSVISILSLLLYSALAILTILFLHKKKVIALGLTVYIIPILAVSNYFTPIPGLIADRFLFIPSLGWCIVFVFLLSWLFNFKNSSTKNEWALFPKRAKYSFALLLILYSTITFSRNFDWKDDLTLFRNDISYVHESAQANSLLAIHLMQKSYDVDPINQNVYRREAIEHFNKALKIYPGFYNVAFDLGRTYSILNQTDSAILYFQKAIAIDSSNTDAHLNVGKMLMSQQKLVAAIPYFEYITAHLDGSSDYRGYESLSFIYFTLKDYDKSLGVNKIAMKKMPSLPDPPINIGRTFMGMNQPDSARFYFQKALEVSPGNQTASQLLFELKQPF